MKCSKCNKEISDESKFCQYCGATINNDKQSDTQTEKEDVKKTTIAFNKKLMISVCVVICAILIIFTLCLNKDLFNTNEDTSKVVQTSANIQMHNNNISFYNMKNANEEYTDEQKAILDYFDNDYFEIYYKCDELQRYPEVFKNAKIAFHISVKKVLKSDSNEFIAIGYICDFIYGDTDQLPLEENDQSKLIVVKGNQLAKRIMEGDERTIYGRYIDTDTYEVDGKTYILPTVETLKVVETNYLKYDFDTVSTIAKTIFGNNIKLSTPEIENRYDEPYGIYGTENPDNFYLITLDNQANSNFKYFDIYTNRTNISYDPKYNEIAEGTIKKLFISADFEHFIVTTYDSGLKHVYIEYYDKAYNKIWTREFSYNSDIINESPMDYTTDKMAIVVDNDLYLINLENGEDIIEPVIVSSSTERVNMMSDGVLLIGSDSKDTIMKVDYSGNILYRNNVSLSQYTVYGTYMQVVNDKMVIVYDVVSETEGARYKYVILNSDGKIELES